MAEEVTSSKGGSPPKITGLRRASTVDESAQLRRRPTKHTLSGPASPNIEPRRGSSFSEYSLSEARKQFQSSTDDLLLPRPSAAGEDAQPGASHWHSAPLAFALLPAIGGMLFKDGSSVVTDITLLGLAAIFLNWTIRIPWAWYHSAQQIRRREEYNIGVVSESGDEHNSDVLQASSGKAPENGPISKLDFKRTPRYSIYNRASNELYIHEVIALLSCFLFPLLGAYLLHSIRGSLSRPSEGLVSDYNLTIFLLASEIRPIAHLIKLIQFRTLHLQRVVNSNPYEIANTDVTTELKVLMRRLEELEARNSARDLILDTSTQEDNLSGKQAVLVTTEVRRTVQPELDALNRAVRRYEKRATVQTMQTESRLLDMEAQLADAISLAAAAAQKSQHQYGFTSLMELIVGALSLPLRVIVFCASLPFAAIIVFINFGRMLIAGRQSAAHRWRKGTNGKPVSPNRSGSDRVKDKERDERGMPAKQMLQ